MKVFDRRLFLLAAAVCALPSFAQQRLVAEGPKALRIAEADMVCQIDAQGRQISPQYFLKTGEIAREAPSWVMAWDNWNCNPTVNPPSANANYYGTNTPNWRAGNTYKAFMWANDLTKLAPGTQGKQARYIFLGANWNPGGTDPRSGAQTLVINLFPSNGLDLTGMGPTQSDFLPGVQLAWSNLNAGFYILSANLSSVSFGLPLPNDGGTVMTRAATRDGAGNLVALSGTNCTQPIMKAMLSDQDTLLPGTNPAFSTPLQWQDDSTKADGGAANTPDYIFQDGTNTADLEVPFSELYDFTGWVATEMVHAAQSFFIDANALSISGKVAWNDLADPTTGPKSATFEIRDAGTNAVVSTQTVAVTPAGDYYLLDPAQATGGNYKIGMKSSHWLRSIVSVDTTDLASKTVNFNMVNGDIDDDNAVTVFDYNALSDAFDSAPGDGNWNPMADLDGDGGVTVFDYNILSANFDMVGDEF